MLIVFFQGDFWLNTWQVLGFCFFSYQFVNVFLILFSPMLMCSPMVSVEKSFESLCWHRRSDIKVRSLVVDEEKIGPGRWCGSVVLFLSVLWHCLLGDKKVICLVRKHVPFIHIGFAPEQEEEETEEELTDPGSPGKWLLKWRWWKSRPVRKLTVCVFLQWLLDQRLVQRLVEMIDPSQSSEVIPIFTQMDSSVH